MLRLWASGVVKELDDRHSRDPPAFWTPGSVGSLPVSAVGPGWQSQTPQLPHQSTGEESGIYMKTDSVGLCLQSVLIQIKHPCHTPQFQEVTPHSFNKSVFRRNFHTDLQTYLVQISLYSAAKVTKTQQRNSISMALPRGACTEEILFELKLY